MHFIDCPSCLITGLQASLCDRLRNAGREYVFGTGITFRGHSDLNQAVVGSCSLHWCWPIERRDATHVRSVYVSNQNQSASLSLSCSYWHWKFVFRCGFLLRVKRFVKEYPFTVGCRGTFALKSPKVTASSCLSFLYHHGCRWTDFGELLYFNP